MTAPIPDPGPPRLIRMHASDNVAIVANTGGLPEGTVVEGGIRLRERVPQGHKVALVDRSAAGPGASIGQTFST